MATARDPVCGMDVDTATARKLDHGSHAHYFCSEACEQAFRADPARYHDAHAAAGAGDDVEMEKHEPPRTTTGNWTSPKFGSAGSGGLEYEKIPEQHDHDKH